MAPSSPKEDAVEAWYIDESLEDHRLPHHREPKAFISSDKLKELGLLLQVKKGDENVDEELKSFCEAKGYSQFEIEVSPEKLPNYEVTVEKFFHEHLHADEERLYVVDGSGYFDVRDKGDSWIRIAVKKGCIIALPPGIYHRFSLDTTSNFIKAIRLGVPLLAAYGRPSDDLPARKEYVEALMKKEDDCHAVEAC